jgi:hypothetical protein
MLTRWTGGPLDGLQRELEPRHIGPTMVVQCWEPRGAAPDLTTPLPEGRGGLAAGEVAHYRARQWRIADDHISGQLLCVEYVHEATRDTPAPMTGAAAGAD